MTERVLTLRDLNRATLARQLLLERSSPPVTAALEHLVGMQAQLASAPYIGLWSRLVGFQQAALTQLIAQRQIVKATLMRATLHLFTAADYQRLRHTLQPVLDDASASIAASRGAQFDRDALLQQAAAYIGAQPRTFAEISAAVSTWLPDVDIGALRYTIRTHLPLVQVPSATRWSYPGQPQFALAETWLGQRLSPEDRLPELIRRYLAAFGPATITDMQKWSGFSKLKPAFEALRPQLVTYRDETRRELFDLPDRPLPDAAWPAPVRFLPEYDNLLLAHDKRTRIIADAYRSQVFLPGLRVRATFLVDGFIRGGWRVETQRGGATLHIEPFAPLGTSDQAALADEAEALVRFIEPEARQYAVQFAPPTSQR